MRTTFMLTAALLAFAGAAQAQNLSIPAGDAAFGREAAVQAPAAQPRDYQAFVTGQPVRVAPAHHRGVR